MAATGGTVWRGRWQTRKAMSPDRFAPLWAGSTATNLADGLFKFALPVLAARMTSSPGLVAGVGFAITLPWLLFALPAGALVDRWDRRRIMVGANLLRGIVVALLAGAVAFDLEVIALLYACALIAGIAETLADTASSAALPSLVPPARLEGANARLIGSQTVANEFVGPPLGGLLVAAGVALAIGTSAALYLVAAAALLMLPTVRRVENSPVERRTGLTTEIAEGLRFLWNHALLRTLALIVAVMNLGWSALLSVLVLYAVAPGPMDLSTFGYGLLLTGLGIGGLAGTILAAPVLRVIGRRWAIGVDILGTVVLVGTPALTANLWAVGTAAILGGIGGTMWGVVVVSIRQQVVPDALQGRVSGVFRLFGFGAMAVGAALAGIVAELAGVRTVFALSAALNLVLFVPFFTTVTERTMADALRVAVKRDLARNSHDVPGEQRGA